jgi:coenzyme F420-dependent glucose-6-phosphate dehydrogenase
VEAVLLKLGYKASAEQFGPRELLEFCCLAERLNFDSVFISDHFQPWKHHGGHAPFSLSWLGAVGARTTRVVLGTSVVTPTFRYHPSIVAQAMATLAVLCPGRVILGVGTGESLNEVPATGMQWPGFKERQGRLREAIMLMRGLWTQERLSFKGEYYQTQNATIYDRPSTAVPIYVAASGPSAAFMAGELGDGFVCTSGKGTELYREKLLPNVAAGLKRAGRAADSIERMIELKVSFGPDLQECMAATRHWGALALSADEKMNVMDPVEMEHLAEALPLERVASRWIVSSDADEHVEKIRSYVELGFRHLVFHFPGTDQERSLALYAAEILPRLRAQFGSVGQ